MVKFYGKFPMPAGTVSFPMADIEPGEGFIYSLEGDIIEVKGVTTTDFLIFDARRELYSALKEAVELYGKPGGPWNVPGDPGSWIEKAKKALKKARGEA